jgi:hypothetical protein
LFLFLFGSQTTTLGFFVEESIKKDCQTRLS